MSVFNASFSQWLSIKSLKPKANILSLFDGISAGRLALERAGIEVGIYYRSEIDKFANKVAMHHYPDDVQLGDVTKWREWDIDWASIDILIGGSPCQGFSFAGKQLAFNDSRSALFFVYVEILNHIKSLNPNVKFMLENVKMKKEFVEVINVHLGVEPVVINSALMSAQNRVRLYWCNWDLKQPEDKGILLKDILEEVAPPEFNLSEQAIDYMWRLRNGKPRWEYHKNPTEGKFACLTANMYKGVPYGVLQIHGGAIHGRYNEDGSTSQKLECNNQEKTNALTTVQKDNVAVFKPCERIKEGNEGHIATAVDIKGMDCIKRVYGQDGKAPTLTTMGVGHREPKILCNINPSKSGMNGNVHNIKSDKSPCLTTNKGEGLKVGELTSTSFFYRKLTPTECARLQTFPDGWAESIVSNSQAYKAYGNSWTIDVVAHIFKSLVGVTI